MDPSPKGMEEGKAPLDFYEEPKALQGEVEGLESGETHRGLSSRHIQFLALGGCIGTGLFVGSGSTLSTVGPGKWRMHTGDEFLQSEAQPNVEILAPLLMGYIVMSSVVYFVMNMLGEMTTYLPVRGVSVPYLINRFTEPSLGFAVGMF